MTGGALFTADAGADVVAEGLYTAVFTGRSDGFSNKAIARHFDLTENTVKFHLRNIYEKLGVRNRAMAVAVADRLSLLGEA